MLLENVVWLLKNPAKGVSYLTSILLKYSQKAVLGTLQSSEFII